MGRKSSSFGDEDELLLCFDEGVAALLLVLGVVDVESDAVADVTEVGVMRDPNVGVSVMGSLNMYAATPATPCQSCTSAPVQSVMPSQPLTCAHVGSRGQVGQEDVRNARGTLTA